jgi:hypothetical protein
MEAVQEPRHIDGGAEVVASTGEEEGSFDEYSSSGEEANSSGDCDVDAGDDDSGSGSGDDDDSGSGGDSVRGSGSGSGGDSGDDDSGSGGDEIGFGSEGGEEVEQELAMDQNGRIVAGVGGMSFAFRSFAHIFAEADLPRLREDCVAACAVEHAKTKEYSEGNTFWVSAVSEPATSLEQVALNIFRFHTAGATFDPTRSGAEWWTLAMDAEISQVGFHWDKDYSLERDGINASPHLATVTYLSDAGAPTFMTSKTCGPYLAADISGVAGSALLSRPQVGKHISFDGRFLHAAPDELNLWKETQHLEKCMGAAGAAPRRLSFLVNIWLNWVPRDTQECPTAISSRLSPPTLPISLDLQHEMTDLPTVTTVAATAPTTEGDQGQGDLRWKFQVGRQRAVITLTIPLETVKAAGAAAGASVLLHSSGMALQPGRQGEGVNACGGNECTPLVRVMASTKPLRKRKRKEGGGGAATIE